ncbi:hypothetical protein GCM10010174_88490 [Kutzneria viridogrisea]|uniref:Uncharacterized protein n=1 Tax=Kutzneria viridogrisea TaxID=47990 RepID=A0ABR6BIZ9_9PSEU|nr:hypothetical protein [Kutzneria viridogrisea]
MFVDRLLDTVVQLRHGVTHAALATWIRANRSTIARVVNEIRALQAERGCRIDPRVWLRTFANVVAYTHVLPQTVLMDTTEVRVRHVLA